MAITSQDRREAILANAIFNAAKELLEKNFSGSWYGRLEQLPIKDLSERAEKAARVAVIRSDKDHLESARRKFLHDRYLDVRELANSEEATEDVMKLILMKLLVRRIWNAKTPKPGIAG